MATVLELLTDRWPDWRDWPPDVLQLALRALRGRAYLDWYEHGAREGQKPPPGDWDAWLLIAGRGYGKTRTGGEWAWRKAKKLGEGSRGALVSPTASDVRDVIVEGESGLLEVCPPDFMPLWEPSKRRLTYPNGALQFTYSADKPDRLRGPQHHYAWVDEWAAMARGHALMSMLDLGLRLGEHPQKLVTTTPRPLPWLKELMEDTSSVMTSGSTYDNLDNLAPTFKRAILRRYEGTRLGRQELHAEFLTDVEGALWTLEMIERGRVDAEPPRGRTVVAVDPAVSVGEDSDETGIVVAAAVPESIPARFTVLADRSGKYSPNEWATVASRAAEQWGADAIVAETNQGGDMVKETLARVAPWASYRPVWAGPSKRVRAEPVAALYEQGRVAHVGVFTELEDQMASWVPDKPGARSPDRLDALVWALTDLARRDVGPVQKFST